MFKVETVGCYKCGKIKFLLSVGKNCLLHFEGCFD